MPTALALLTFTLAMAVSSDTAPAATPDAPAPVEAPAPDPTPAPRPRSVFGAAIAEMTRTLQARQAPAVAAQGAPVDIAAPVDAAPTDARAGPHTAAAEPDG